MHIRCANNRPSKVDELYLPIRLEVKRAVNGYNQQGANLQQRQMEEATRGSQRGIAMVGIVRFFMGLDLSKIGILHD